MKFATDFLVGSFLFGGSLQQLVLGLSFPIPLEPGYMASVAMTIRYNLLEIGIEEEGDVLVFSWFVCVNNSGKLLLCLNF